MLLLLTKLALILGSFHPSPDGALAPQASLAWGPDEGPPAREHAVFVLDGDRAIVAGGSGYTPYGQPLRDAWALDLDSLAWEPIEVTGSEHLAGGSRRAAPIAGGALLFGGYGQGMEASDALLHVEFTEYELSVRPLEQRGAPPARALHAFGCDAAGERLVVFGGASEEAFGDTWIGRRSGDVVEWRELDTTEGPGPRFGFAFGVDPAGPTLFVCGGQIPSVDGTGLATASDLWSLDFGAPEPSWTRVAEYDPQDFPGRRNPAFAFDPVAGDLYVWGGTADGRRPLPGLYAVHAKADGAPLEILSLEDAKAEGITTRASGFGLVDARRDRVLLGFGNTAQQVLRDLAIVDLAGGRGRTAAPAGD